MNHEHIMLSERSQTQKTKDCMIPLHELSGVVQCQETASSRESGDQFPAA